MIQIFSSISKRFLNSVERSEADLNKFLSDNWRTFFPQYTFIKSEFFLDGMVRSKTAAPGRIDILAFNPTTNKFVIFELKKHLDKNILSQASDYKDFVEDHFSDVYLTAKDHNFELPNHKNITKDSIELVLIAKDFNELNINKAQKNNEITLIKYIWLENDLLLIQYLNNQPIEYSRKEKNNPEQLGISLKPQINVPQKSMAGDAVTLKSDRKGVLAHGKRLDGNKIMILAGSKISDNPEPGFEKNAPTAFRMRKEFENDGTIGSDGKFTCNITLAKSTAESVIKGGSRDGSGWK